MSSLRRQDFPVKLGNIRVPIIVRLQGTNAEEAKKLIDESGLQVFSPASLMISIVAIARPAPFTIQPTFPSSFTKFRFDLLAST